MSAAVLDAPAGGGGMPEVAGVRPVRVVDQYLGERFAAYCGDSVEVLDGLPDACVGHSVWSPPFPGMYAYTNSPRDLGNCRTLAEMIEQLRFVVARDKLLRVLVPGRTCAVHLCQLTAMLSRDGYIGLKDFRGQVIALMESEGWIYAGEVTIDKNPQIQATRNKDRGLLFKSLATDASVLRPALADYLLLFRKPGTNPEPIRAGVSKKYNPGGGWVTEEEWVEWAAPVWYRAAKGYPGGVRETDVLNVRQAKETDDERHLCPLQLGVVERSVKLWSNPGDVVFSPFGGIGSEGYGAIRLNRRAVLVELKRSYFDALVENCVRAEREAHQPDLFDFADAAGGGT